MTAQQRDQRRKFLRSLHYRRCFPPPPRCLRPCFPPFPPFAPFPPPDLAISSSASRIASCDQPIHPQSVSTKIRGQHTGAQRCCLVAEQIAQRVTRDLPLRLLPRPPPARVPPAPPVNRPTDGEPKTAHRSPRECRGKRTGSRPKASAGKARDRTCARLTVARSVPMSRVARLTSRR